MPVPVVRATTDSGDVYEFLADFSRVRRLTSASAEGAVSQVALAREDGWLHIVPVAGSISPTSLDDLRVGDRLTITMQTSDLSTAARYTTPLVSVESSEEDVNYIFS